MTTKTHSPAYIVWQWAFDLQLVGDIAHKEKWPGFINYKPDKPNSIIIFTDDTGQPNGRGHKSRISYELPAVQIYVRAGRNKEQQAYDRCALFKAALDKASKVTVALDEDFSYEIKNFVKISPIRTLGRSPESDRPAFAIDTLLDYRSCTNYPNEKE